MVSSPELLSLLFMRRNILARVLVWRSTTFGELKVVLRRYVRDSYKMGTPGR
jgi:hypothetical protein